ncbi:MAG: exonuclease SbcCD subunit D [Gemmatimonadales bacterium]
MRIAHVADLHLGYRQYHRQTADGSNQREADVALAFRRVIAEVIDQAPDVVIVAGDVFHSVRPTNSAILEAFRQFSLLAETLANVPVIVIAGNHDTPRSTETGSILTLLEAIDTVTVVSADTGELLFPNLETSIACVPYASLVSSSGLRVAPNPDCRWNVLVTHGEVAGALPWNSAQHEYGGAQIELDDLRPETWSYIALGHYHVARPVAPNAWYSGSTEYVSTNPWGELKAEAAEGRPTGKGWLLVELRETAAVTFRPIQLARKFADLEEIFGAGLIPEELDRLLEERIEATPEGINNNVVRQVIREVPRGISRQMDHTKIRAYKASALHFNLDVRKPEVNHEIGLASPATRKTVPEILLDYLATRPLDADVDRGRVRALARTCLDTLAEQESV